MVQLSLSFSQLAVNRLPGMAASFVLREVVENGSPSAISFISSSALRSRLSFKPAWRRKRKCVK